MCVSNGMEESVHKNCITCDQYLVTEVVHHSNHKSNWEMYIYVTKWYEMV